MRARSASTFTIDDLREIAKICDEHGVKSYLTINTIIYDEDITLMRKIVDAAKEAGISAVIAADVAVMAYCNEVGQEVHLSTQLNISNAEALKFYSRFADVVVLARELNLKQVRKITMLFRSSKSRVRWVSWCVSKCSATELCVWPFRKVLFEPERAECFGQSRSLHAGMPSCVYGKG